MITLSEQIFETSFSKSIDDYHILDNVEQPLKCPFAENSFEAMLYKKNWIDTIQWHLEDIIRDQNIKPEYALTIKRKIDSLNQNRTDLVEKIDIYIYNNLKQYKANKDCYINTESIGWAIDRLSILFLKIYHMKIETEREDSEEQHKKTCKEKLDVLNKQKQTLVFSITELYKNVVEGKAKFETYFQMKMYNDKDLNPILYNKK